MDNDGAERIFHTARIMRQSFYEWFVDLPSITSVNLEEVTANLNYVNACSTPGALRAPGVEIHDHLCAPCKANIATVTLSTHPEGGC